jgi:hypothetical protein
MRKLKEIKRNKGQVLLIMAILFTVVATTAVLALSSPIVNQLQMARTLELSKKSYFAAEAGSEDAFYKIKNGLQTSYPEVLELDDSQITVSTAVTDINEQDILSVGSTDNHIRSVIKGITVTDGFSFNFALQIGLGGLFLYNNAQVVGNVYSNGPVVGSDKTKNIIFGDAVSAGSSGSVSGIRATSSVYARSITNSTVDKDAHYVTISGTTVGGVSYPGSSDQPLATMPIPDSLLDDWEAAATSGGVINSPCPYIISSGTVTLGPVKINCDLVISGNATTLILNGPVWVKGDFTINNDPKFKVSDSLGNKSVSVIAHSTANPSGSGLITLNNNPQFYGSVTNGVTNPDSYIMFASRNTSASTGGSIKAITAGNSVTGNLLLYAPYGEINISNNVALRQVTAYKLSLLNNTVIYYTIGLAQPLFMAGPGGQWKIRRWNESQ